MRIENVQIDLVALPLSECGERSEVFVGPHLPSALRVPQILGDASANAHGRLCAVQTGRDE